jgi:hypothetical protein
MVLFISETYLKNNTALSGNIDSTELLPYIAEAQTIYIKPLIGSLYSELQTRITDNNLTPKDIELLDLIAPALSLYTVYQALPTLHLKLRNKGVLKQAGEFTVNADLRDIQFLRQDFQSRAAYYVQRIIDFIGKDDGCNERVNTGFQNPFIF